MDKEVFKRLRHTIAVLLQHNRWRRDENVPNSRKTVDPTELGEAIDDAIVVLRCVPDMLELLAYCNELVKGGDDEDEVRGEGEAEAGLAGGYDEDEADGVDAGGVAEDGQQRDFSGDTISAYGKNK